MIQIRAFLLMKSIKMLCSIQCQSLLLPLPPRLLSGSAIVPECHSLCTCCSKRQDMFPAIDEESSYYCILMSSTVMCYIWGITYA